VVVVVLLCEAVMMGEVGYVVDASSVFRPSPSGHNTSREMGMDGWMRGCLFFFDDFLFS